AGDGEWGMGNAGAPNEIGPVESQRVSFDDLYLSPFPIPHSPKCAGEPSVLLNRDDPGDSAREFRGEGPPPRPDLDHDVRRGRVERVGDAAQELGIGEKVLAQPFPGSHALSSSRVRSSAAGAPPV